METNEIKRRRRDILSDLLKDYYAFLMEQARRDRIERWVTVVNLGSASTSETTP